MPDSVDQNSVPKTEPLPEKENKSTVTISRKTVKCKDCENKIGARLSRCDKCHHIKVCFEKKECDCINPPKIFRKGNDFCLLCKTEMEMDLVCRYCQKCYSCDPYFNRLIHGDYIYEHLRKQANDTLKVS